MKTKLFIVVTCFLIVSTFITSCAPGKLFIQTPTPTMSLPTLTSTPTFTSTPAASPTLPPTATSAPTATPPPPTPTVTSVSSNNGYTVFNTIQGPDQGIASLALSPNGNLLAYGSYADNQITLVDVLSGKQIQTLAGHTTPVCGLVFSPDGKLLASTGTVNLPPEKDGSVRIWDVSSGKQIDRFDTTGVDQLAFSPDGKLLAAEINDASGQVMLWDVAENSLQRTIPGVLLHVSFSPDGKYLVAGSRDNIVHMIEVSSGQEVQTLEGHEGMTSVSAFSPNGELLATGASDMVIQLWNAKTGEKIKALRGHLSEVGELVFNPQGTVLASAGNGLVIKKVSASEFSITISSEDEIVRFWDIQTGEQIGKIVSANGISAVSFSQDWSVIATGDSKGVIELRKMQ